MDEKTAVIILIAIAGIIASVFISAVIYRKKMQRIYKEIEMMLDSFRNRTADSYDVASEISGKDLDRINRQLKRISDMIRIVQENAALEKEDTRSVVTDIAHQLKTPLAASKMNIELLTDETLSNTEKREFFNRLRFSMEELETLMNSLVNISRMETGLIKLDMKRLPVEDTLRNSVSCIIGKAEEKEIAIEVVSDEDAQEPICHDSRWLCEAFINVLDNSIKYSPHGSCIKITVTRRSAYFRIDFEDEGIGIPKNEYHKAMSRFYRGSHEEVKNTKGSGVGLYLVNKIVRMHNGMVTIRSGHGKSPEYPGTVIIIQIPL